MELAEEFGRRVCRELPADDARRARAAFRWTLGRSPSAAERDRLLAGLPLPAVPTSGSPELVVWMNVESPWRCRPAGLLNDAVATWPSTLLSPLEN